MKTDDGKEVEGGAEREKEDEGSSGKHDRGKEEETRGWAQLIEYSAAKPSLLRL